MKKIFLVTKEGFFAPDLIWKFLRRFLIVDDQQAADMIFVLGGDGTMLSAIRAYWKLGKPFLGINFGHVGFLMNDNTPKILAEITEDKFDVVENQMLCARVFQPGGSWNEFAANDFYFRIGTNGMMAKIKVTINKNLRFDPLACDGVIVSTAAGSTAYNASAGGTILPIGTPNIVLTGISPAIYHRFRTIQLAGNTEIILEPQETDKRPTYFFADGQKVNGITRAKITLSPEIVRLLYAKSEDYHQKVQDIQFPDWKV